MNDPKILGYSQQLKELRIAHEILEHPDLKTVEGVQNYLGYAMADSCPAIVMKAGDAFVVIVRRGDYQLDSKKVKKVLGVEKLRLATKEEFEKITGLPVGAARVFIPHLQTLLDQKLFEKEFLNGGTGSFTCTFRYKTEDLKKIPNSVVVDVAESREEEVLNRRGEKMQRVLSGIRATGRLHLGNYLGAVKGMLALQEDPRYETFYTVVDIHATTTPYDPKTLPDNTRSVVLDYLACGIDPQKSGITVQSNLADLITQLAFYFSTVTNVGRMQDLPTFKEKVRQYPKNVTMALLNYPVLMAADILIYKASLVPVGIDQEPHLEVAREIARRMNEMYDTDFPEPKRFATQGEYIPSLTGEGKMSKTVEGSFINLTDSLEEIKKRLAAVPTDSGKGKMKVVPQYDASHSRGLRPRVVVSRVRGSGVPADFSPEKNQGPSEKDKTYVSETGIASSGVKTLMEFVELFQGRELREEYERQYQSTGIRYADLKTKLAEAIYRELEPIQKRRAELERDAAYVKQVLRDGARRARTIAEQTVREVREKMGLMR